MSMSSMGWCYRQIDRGMQKKSKGHVSLQQPDWSLDVHHSVASSALETAHIAYCWYLELFPLSVGLGYSSTQAIEKVAENVNSNVPGRT